jgi:hypothetical protein
MTLELSLGDLVASGGVAIGAGAVVATVRGLAREVRQLAGEVREHVRECDRRQAATERELARLGAVCEPSRGAP